MKLAFEQGSMAEDLYQELGFAHFLALFDRHLPILPSLILRPLTTAEGKAHFQALRDLEEGFNLETVTQLLSLSRDLPLLDSLLPRVQAGQLEQYHLFELGRFLQADLLLHQAETRLGVALARHLNLDKIQAVLARRTNRSFSLINLSGREDGLRQAIDQNESELAEALVTFEKQIHKRTGLKMIYPWPKEIALSQDLLSLIKDCELVTAQQYNDLWRIDFRPGPVIQSLVARRDRLSAEFEALMAAALAELNRELVPFYPAFADYYQARKQRTWLYLLIAISKEHGFCLPHLRPEPGCRLEQAVLPSLKLRKHDRCVPLDLGLSPGTNVLYGANMSGKTTVLKTAFFIFTLIRFGLPVPAKEIEMHFPEHVFLMLKSSGNITRDTSTFGEEVAFFSQPLPDGAFVLVDELFSSTDPVNGAILSQIILSELNRRKLVFFCSSHYPEVLDIAAISLFRMQDINTEALPVDITDIRTLQDRMPYRLEKVSEPSQRARIRTNHAPLEIALLFPLPNGIKEQIRRHLKHSFNDPQ